MKVLVLSLLRLGDLIQHSLLIERLREKLPGAEIDVLCDSSSAGARDLGIADGFHLFPRAELQKRIGTAECNILKPVIDVQDWASSIAERDYDLLINLTHTRLSAYVAAMIPAREKRGLVAGVQGFEPLENSWQRYMDTVFTEAGECHFHYLELLSNSFGLPVQPVAPEVRNSFILLQPFTSDEKKNWNLLKWQELYRLIKQTEPRRKLFILGTPENEMKLRALFPREDIVIDTLRGVRDLLREATILITGDTSIKHLAAKERTPVIEIVLGSSVPSKTAAFQVGAKVIVGQAPCSPCPQTGACSHARHLCEDGVDVDLVFETLVAHFRGSQVEASQGAVVLETDYDAEAGWLLVNSSATAEERSCQIERKKKIRLSLNQGGVHERQSRGLSGISASAS